MKRLLAALAASLLAPAAAGATLDLAADAAAGQVTLTTFAAGGGQNGLTLPVSTAVHPLTGRLFVADRNNHRILSWISASAYATGASADIVIGQPDFATVTAGTTASKLAFPYGVAVDEAGNLYVSDQGNNRVVIYPAPLTSGMAATKVIGQASFTANTANAGGRSATSLDGPWGLTVDSAGRLFVADYENHRVLGFANPLAQSAPITATTVYGQVDFASGTCNAAGAPSATTVCGPSEVSTDGLGNLWVADHGNSRVLRYDNVAGILDGTADLVIGQADMVSRSPATTASQTYFPYSAVTDRGGALLVADSSNRVLRFKPPFANGMAATSVIGQAGFNDSATGTGPTGLNDASGLSVDPMGNVYVADYFNNRVLRYDQPFLTPRAPADLAGNGRSRLVWRATDGGFSVWTLVGAAATEYTYGLVDSDWKLLAAQDFDGDRKDDLFWRRTSDGATYLWFMNASVPTAFTNTGVVPVDYQVAAIGDFNGDGRADIFFRRTSDGGNYMWLMNGGAILQQGDFGSPVTSNYQVLAAADLTGDGKADIIWRESTSGGVFIWPMDGLTVSPSAGIGTAKDATWSLAGIGDFDGNGTPDLLWRKTDGTLDLWLMSGQAATTPVTLATPGADWTVESVADANADGHADIIFRNSTSGEFYIWLMNGQTIRAGGSLGAPGAIWSIAQP
jgi:hypothetical protein